MQNSDFPNLPRSWQVKTLGEVCDILDNMRKPINATEREQRLKNSTHKYAYYGATGQVGYIDDFLCDFESILLGEDGAPFLEPFKDKAYIVSGKYWVNNHAHILRAKENLTINKFLCHFLNIVDYMPYVSGTTRLKLNQSAMKQIKIPIPPLEIQKHIVKRLDEAFSRIENGTKHLQSAKDNLTKYKQSLLKSAFNGTLTQDCPLLQGESTHLTHPLAPSAREGEKESCHPTTNEKQKTIHAFCHTDSVHCHTERSEVSKSKGADFVDTSAFSKPQYDKVLDSRNDENSPSLAEGVRGWVNPINDNALDCHADKSAHNDDKDLLNGKSANLPQSWVIKTLGEIAFVTKLAGFEYTKYIYPNLVNSGIPLFKGKNIQSNKLVLEFESYIPKNISNQLERSKLSKKCILTPYVGSIGNVAIFDGSFEAHLGSNVGKIEILNNYALEEYVFYFLQSSVGYLELTKHKKATAQESISISAIRDVKIPIPPLETQKQIVAILDGHFTSADKVSAYIETCLTKAKQLKSSLLKSAFEGELV